MWQQMELTTVESGEKKANKVTVVTLMSPCWVIHSTHHVTDNVESELAVVLRWIFSFFQL